MFQPVKKQLMESIYESHRKWKVQFAAIVRRAFSLALANERNKELKETPAPGGKYSSFSAVWERDMSCFLILELLKLSRFRERRGNNSWWLKITCSDCKKAITCGNQVHMTENQTATGERFTLNDLQVFVFVLNVYPHVCRNWWAISPKKQQWGLLSVMWASRLPPIELELLAEAFLPLLSGGWRGIICQHAGSHCIWAGTNAASIRQLDPGVCTYSVCGWMPHMYMSTFLFFARMYIKCVQWVYELTLVRKHTHNHETKKLHFYVNRMVGWSLSLYVYICGLEFTSSHDTSRSQWFPDCELQCSAWQEKVSL